jgi:hypothetical protein
MARALDREQLAARRGASDPLGERRLRAVVRARDREQGACRRQPGRRARAARPQSRSRCASGWKTTRSGITSTFAGSLRGRHLSAPDRAAFLGRRHRPLALEPVSMREASTQPSAGNNRPQAIVSAPGAWSSNRTDAWLRCHRSASASRPRMTRAAPRGGGGARLPSAARVVHLKRPSAGRDGCPPAGAAAGRVVARSAAPSASPLPTEAR